MASRIYTRTGDSGETGLFGGQRVFKDDLRVEAYGSADELNAVLGVARAHCADADLDAQLRALQEQLFELGADLATPLSEEPERGRITIRRIGAADVRSLEELIDRWEADLPPLKNFILPGGHPSAAALHQSRAVCRRAERCCVRFLRMSERHEGASQTSHVLIYLNRLSDLLFVLARAANQRHNVAETIWKP